MKITHRNNKNEPLVKKMVAFYISRSILVQTASILIDGNDLIDNPPPISTGNLGEKEKLTKSNIEKQALEHLCNHGDLYIEYPENHYDVREGMTEKAEELITKLFPEFNK